MNVRDQAQRQKAQLIQAEAIGRGLAMDTVRKIEAKAIAAARSGKKFVMTKQDRADLQTALADLMAGSFTKRYQQLSTALELGFEAKVKKTAKQMNLDLPNIHEAFYRQSTGHVTVAADDMEFRINRALQDTSIKQQPTKIAVRNMKRKMSDMGLSPTNPSLVETLVRTHAQMSFNAAQYQMEQDDPEELITGWQYVTVGDDRVRDEHAEMDGHVFKKGDPNLQEWWPPNGWNCRCQMVALTDPVRKSHKLPGVEPDPGFAGNPATGIMGDLAEATEDSTVSVPE